MKMKKNRDDVIEKVKKLMNIAHDPEASENEIFVATKQAHKLMAKYNIEIDDIESKNENDVINTVLDVCPNYLMPIIQIIANEFRCEFLYISRRNRFVPHLYGLKHDILAAVDVIENVKTFINKNLPRYIKEYKKKSSSNDLNSLFSGYIQYDARILKRSYCLGFASQLKVYFEMNKLELKDEFNKQELMVLGIPEIVTDFVNEIVKPKKVKQKELIVSGKAYRDGISACDQYQKMK